MSVAKSSLESEPEGFVEGITRHGARGWAWLPNMPDAAVEVEAVLKGEVIGRVVADRLRQDLLERDYGNGHHGFEVIFSKPVTGDVVPMLRVVGPEGFTRLRGADSFAAYTVSSHSAIPAERDSPRGSDPSGYVECITRTEASGWAWLPSAPDAGVKVEAVLIDAVIGRAIADNFRKDLADRKFGNGRHGFELRFVTRITGDEPPRLRVVTNTGFTPIPGNYRLRLSPRAESPVDSKTSRVATPAASQRHTPVGYVERLTRLGARG